LNCLEVKFFVLYKNIEREQVSTVRCKNSSLRCHRTESMWLVGGLDTAVTEGVSLQVAT